MRKNAKKVQVWVMILNIGELRRSTEERANEVTQS